MNLRALYYIHEDTSGGLHVISEEVEIHSKSVRVRPGRHNDQRAILKKDQVSWYYSHTSELAIQRYIESMLHRIGTAERNIEMARKNIEKAKQL